MNLKEIKEMINLMNENNLVELEVEKEGMRIKIRRFQEASDSAKGRPVEYKVESVPASKASDVAGPASEVSKGTKEIVSPMVGTFYRAPSPEAAAFVEAGQTVEIGQVVCIIEAMKLMNEIKSEIRGRIMSVEVENAEPVEFGQVLFRVEPV